MGPSTFPYLRPMVPGLDMVQSRASTVDSYLAELPDDRRAAIARMRALAVRFLKGFDEKMEFGMPYYRGPGGRGIGFASQARYIAIYCGEPAAERARQAGLDVGKSCTRFPHPDRIDWAVVEDLFRLTAR